ncbi:hypothetical protein MLD38_033862 [Melastoma candidum]|uniref:Uncharacterized protein n=1 Tax=Melastoma candidum TaxID=119954 RepID=A0ACB9M8P9_9MYRT|nr:hypothetical protein MLD38_033862 [Melastoma candidum]
MGKKQHLDWGSGSIMSAGSERVSLLNKDARTKSKQDSSEENPPSDLENGDAVQAANVSFCRVFSLAKPDTGKLAIGTVALLIASTSSILIVNLLGNIVSCLRCDIVSREIRAPEEQVEPLNAVRNTILDIFLIVVVGALCTALKHGYLPLPVKESLLVLGRTCLVTLFVRRLPSMTSHGQGNC